MEVLLTVLTTSEKFVLPTLLCFCFFIWWRLNKIEGRISAKLENGILTSITEVKILATESSLKAENVLVALREHTTEQQSFEEEVKKELTVTRTIGNTTNTRLARLIEKCNLIHGGSLHEHRD